MALTEDALTIAYPPGRSLRCVSEEFSEALL